MTELKGLRASFESPLGIAYSCDEVGPKWGVLEVLCHLWPLKSAKPEFDDGGLKMADLYESGASNRIFIRK